MRYFFTILFVIIFTSANMYAQEDSTKTEKIKKGFSMGGVPVVAYDSDIGFKYGGLVNLYHYGDGTRYPNYNHSLYLELSRTTKGSGVNLAVFETQTLIPNLRMTIEAGYFTELTLNFYGFNGYNVDYNKNFIDDKHSDYISRVYYRHARELLRLKADLQGNIKSKKIRWLAGFVHYGTTLGKVDIDKLNEGQDTEDILPDTAALYDKYVEWGIIKDDQKNGGNANIIKAGLVYDTRDNEANPNGGIWSELLFLSAPGLLKNDYSFLRIMLTHRQYFTLIKDRLTFAYRLSYQSKIAGEQPFYMLPFVFDSKSTKNGLGGAKNLRGIMRNRVVGDGFLFGNFEFRWKFFKSIILNQNLYIALNTFIDAGTIVSDYSFDKSGVTAGYGNTKEENLKILNNKDNSIHSSYGAGIRFAINNNFIIAVDYGRVFNSQDGKSGLYIGLDYIF